MTSVPISSILAPPGLAGRDRKQTRKKAGKGGNVLRGVAPPETWLGLSAGRERAELESGVVGFSLSTVFSRVSAVEIASMQYWYDNTPFIRAVTEYSLQDMLSGGIKIVDNQNRVNKNAEEFYNVEWVNWARVMMLNLWKFGFAPCVVRPHALFGGVPTNLDPEHIETYVAIDATGKRFYRFMNVSTAAQPEMTDDEREIPNVTTFELNPPSRNGRLHSKVGACVERLEMRSFTRRQVFSANAVRSNPVMVTEEVLAQDPSAYAAMTFDGALRSSSQRSNPMQRAEAQEARQEREIREMLKRGSEQYISPEIAAAQQTSAGTQSLPPRRRLVRQVLPETPGEYHLFRLEAEEIISAVFQVPRAMIIQSEGGNHASDPSGLSSRTFQNAQRALKHQLILFVKDMYRTVYMDEIALDSAVRVNDNGADEIDAIQAASRVKVEIPSVPSLETLGDWSDRKIIRPGSLFDMLARREGVDPSAFYTEQEYMDVQREYQEIPADPFKLATHQAKLQLKQQQQQQQATEQKAPGSGQPQKKKKQQQEKAGDKNTSKTGGDQEKKSSDSGSNETGKDSGEDTTKSAKKTKKKRKRAGDDDDDADADETTGGTKKKARKARKK